MTVSFCPPSRAYCSTLPRPCPRGDCRYHLCTLTRRRRDPLSLDPDWSCALDVADANPDGVTQAELARHIGVTRQRVEQIERKALQKLSDEPLQKHHGEIRRRIISLVRDGTRTVGDIALAVYGANDVGTRRRVCEAIRVMVLDGRLTVDGGVYVTV